MNVSRGLPETPQRGVRPSADFNRAKNVRANVLANIDRAGNPAFLNIGLTVHSDPAVLMMRYRGDQLMRQGNFSLAEDALDAQHRIYNLTDVPVSAMECRALMVDLAQRAHLGNIDQRTLVMYDNALRDFRIEAVADLPLANRLQLAASESVSLQCAAELKKDRSAEVRGQLAFNGALDTATLLELSKDNDPHVRYMVAANPQVPPALLSALADDPEESVRNYVASNPRTPAQTLSTLSQSADGHVQYLVAANPGTDHATLDQLAQNPAWMVALAVAQNPATMAPTMTKLGRHLRAEVRSAAAMHPRTSFTILDRLANDGNAMVRNLVVCNPRASGQGYRRLKQDKASQKMAQQLYNPLLQARPALVRDPNTPAHVLHIMTVSNNPEVRLAMTDNPALPAGILEVLARDPYPAIRLAAAQHCNIPPMSLTALAADRNPEIRAAVARNPLTSLRTRSLLAADHDQSVVNAAAMPREFPTILTASKMRWNKVPQKFQSIMASLRDLKYNSPKRQQRRLERKFIRFDDIKKIGVVHEGLDG
ncbi:MAG: hypothetical protein ACRYGK_12515 [Janthinobacterium lividum]